MDVSNANLITASGYNPFYQMLSKAGAIYMKSLIDENREDDMLPFIANTSILDELTKCGQVIQFDHELTLGSWRPYELDQELQHTTPRKDYSCISICNTDYLRIKVDNEDRRRMCEDWVEYERQFKKAAWEGLSDTWHNDVLTGMMLGASSRNKGATAGRYGVIDLGTTDAPRDLTPDNLVLFVTDLMRVLEDAKRWYAGNMVLIVPKAFRALLIQTAFAKQMCCMINDSVLFKGLQVQDLLGFTLIETNRLQSFQDPNTRKLVHPIIAAWNESYGFAGDVVEVREVISERSFHTFFDFRTVYGGGAIYPEGLALSYVTLSTDGQVPNNP